MRTYQVRALRWGASWELRVAKLGVTQARYLRNAEEMARDYIATKLGVKPDSFIVDVVLPLDEYFCLRVAPEDDPGLSAIAG
jgi:hypothetical protein